MSFRIIKPLLCICLSGAPAFAGGFQLNEHGARGVGMGGAYVARPFDGSAIFINPAGLSYLHGWQFYGGTTLIAPSSRFRGHYPDNPVPEVKMNSNVFFPSNAYVSYTTEDGLGFGIGMFTMFGLGTEWPAGWAGRALSEKVDLKTFFINPSVSVRLGEVVTLGVGFSYIPLSATITRSIRTGFVDSNGNPVEPHIDLEGSGSGTSWNVGVLLQLTRDMNVGLSYRSTSNLKVEGNAVFDKVPASLKGTFPDGPGRTNLLAPANYFGGISYRLMENFTVEADYQYTTWSTFDKLRVELDNGVNGQKQIDAPRNYQNAYLLRFGVEYVLDLVSLRAGYIFDKNPVPDGYLEPSLPDADRNDFTVGIGYKMSRTVTIDASYMFVQFRQRTEEHSIPDFNFNGTYNNFAHLFCLNIGYSFE